MIAPVSNVSAVNASDWIKSVGGPTPLNAEASHQASEADKNSFASMMQSPSTHNVARFEPATHVSSPSMVEKFAATQNAAMKAQKAHEAATALAFADYKTTTDAKLAVAAKEIADMRELLQSTRDLVKAAPHLSMNEMAAFGHEMTLNFAITTTQFNVASNIGKTASKGVDTLMRNQ